MVAPPTERPEPDNSRTGSQPRFDGAPGRGMRGQPGDGERTARAARPPKPGEGRPGNTLVEAKHNGQRPEKEEVGKHMSKLHNWALSKVIAFKHRDEEGQGLAEYGLILALVAVVCIGALSGLAGGINGTLGSVTGKL